MKEMKPRKIPEPGPVMDRYYYCKFWMRKITLRALFDIGKNARQQKQIGKPLLLRWKAEFPDDFEEVAGGNRYDFWIPNTILGDEKDQTWEDGAQAVYKHCNCTMEGFIQQLGMAWNKF